MYDFPRKFVLKIKCHTDKISVKIVFDTSDDHNIKLRDEFVDRVRLDAKSTICPYSAFWETHRFDSYKSIYFLEYSRANTLNGVINTVTKYITGTK